MGHMIDVNGKGKTAIIAIKVDISISSETLVIQIVIIYSNNFQKLFRLLKSYLIKSDGYSFCVVIV